MSSYYTVKYGSQYTSTAAVSDRSFPKTSVTPVTRNRLTLTQARQEASLIFMRAGVKPAAGAINRIAYELVRGTRTLAKLRSDVSWVRTQLLAGKGGTGGHTLIQYPNQYASRYSTSPTTTTRTGTSGSGTRTGGTSGSGGAGASGVDGLGSVGPSKASLEKMARALFPYFPSALMDVFVKAYVEFGGDADLALAKTRQSGQYEKAFPGLLREDGSMRLGSEGEYLSWIEGYKTRLATFGVPTSILNTNRIKQLVAGNVDPVEFGQRIDYVYTQVATNLPEIRAAYAREFGIATGSLSLSSILASALDPGVNPVEMEFRVRRAQVTGEANVAGFSLPVSEATRLAEFGLNQQAARAFYSEARTLLPTLGALVNRHNDPDDDFDLGELTDALIFTDPDQQDRIQRLFAQESSMYSGSALFTARNGALPGIFAD